MAMHDCSCDSGDVSVMGVYCSPCTQPVIRSEPLPSALENFITAFFGTIQKVHNPDGSWTWILPCNLDGGLPENPRLPGEGVACYLLRLIDAGISGLIGPQGPQGIPGDVGAAGQSSFSFTASNFLQPTINTVAQIVLMNADWLAVGAYFFVETSGYYQVTAKVNNTLSARFMYDIGGPGGAITTGKLVHPAGPKGDKGDTGSTGAAGSNGVAGATGPAGPAGADGNNGSTGNETVFVFRRATSQPNAPTGNGVPSGWYLNPPTDTNDALWFSKSRQTSTGVLIGTWSTPTVLDTDSQNVVQGANVGSGVGIYRDKIANLLNFRTLVGGTGVDILQSGDDIYISSIAGGITFVAAPANSTDSGSFGEVAVDEDYFYIHTLTKWKRTAIFEW